jgi:hypothetical protein
MATKKHYIKFWANDDTFNYVKGLKEGTRGNTINEAIRLYSDMNDLAQPTVIAMRDAYYSSATAASDASSKALSSINTVYNSLPANNRLVCPAGHLWMNGSNQCVANKCQYSKK